MNNLILILGFIILFLLCAWRRSSPRSSSRLLEPYADDDTEEKKTTGSKAEKPGDKSKKTGKTGCSDSLLQIILCRFILHRMYQ